MLPLDVMLDDYTAGDETPQELRSIAAQVLIALHEAETRARAHPCSQEGALEMERVRDLWRLFDALLALAN